MLELPKSASAKFLPREVTPVEGTISGFPFRADLEPDGEGGHRLKFSAATRVAIGVNVGVAAVEITRVGEEPEIRVPADLRAALAAAPTARASWAAITPMARRDWILWVSSAKQLDTRARRIEKACDMLAHGKRRVCCFGGLTWLTKDHPGAETWRPLPSAKARPASRPTK